MGLAHVLHRREYYGRLAPWLVRPEVRGVLVLVVLGVLNLAPDLSGWPRLLLHLAMVGLLASWVTGPGSGPRLALLSRLGKVSYGVYLLHLFVMHVLRQSVLPRVPLRFPGDLFIACLLGTWIVAELSFGLYERPFLRLKRRFSST